MKVFKYLDIIGDYIEHLENRHYKYYDSKLLISFRGEPKDFKYTKLMPSLFRDENYLYNEENLFYNSLDYGLINDSDTLMDNLSKIQHYVSVSRMLDITFNCAVALYFACKSNEEDDGYVYIFGFPDYHSPHSLLAKKLANIFSYLNENKNILYEKNFLVFSENYSNERMRAQNGGFIFFPGNIFSSINSIYYKKIKIAAADKKEILEELDKCFKINDSKLFPGEEEQAKYIKKKFIENDYKIKKLDIRGEIETRVDRIKYELLMSNNLEKKDRIRCLRKNEEELKQYIVLHTSDDSKELNDLICLLESRFKILYGFFGG